MPVNTTPHSSQTPSVAYLILPTEHLYTKVSHALMRLDLHHCFPKQEHQLVRWILSQACDELSGFLDRRYGRARASEYFSHSLGESIDRTIDAIILNTINDLAGLYAEIRLDEANSDYLFDRFLGKDILLTHFPY